MDRNYAANAVDQILPVALRKESVDRNPASGWRLTACLVALRKESVDRNPTLKAMRGDRKASLSARRAWIEMPEPAPWQSGPASLSARRAWIEINVGFPIAAFLLMVALRKESVDRNPNIIVNL